MANVTLHLPGETEQKLRVLAAHHGQTLEAYLEQLAERATAAAPSSQALTDEEFERLLDELSEGPPVARLPADFSRADLYTEHD